MLAVPIRRRVTNHRDTEEELKMRLTELLNFSVSLWLACWGIEANTDAGAARNSNTVGTQQTRRITNPARLRREPRKERFHPLSLSFNDSLNVLVQHIAFASQLQALGSQST